MGILAQLAKELQTLTEDAERLPFDEDSVNAIAWRYCRLLWQDKVQLEMVLQLTRIANQMTARNIMVRETLLADPPREEEYKQFLEETAQDEEYNAYLDHKAQRKASEY